MAAPMHAADLYAIATNGTGQDVVDAVDAMTAQHGEFLTALMVRSVQDRLTAEQFIQLGHWDSDCEPMRWTP